MENIWPNKEGDYTIEKKRGYRFVSTLKVNITTFSAQNYCLIFFRVGHHAVFFEP